MERQSKLTNEVLGKKFSSQFDLVNYAIHIAQQLIRSDRKPRVEGDLKNPAQIILEEIALGQDFLKDLDDKEEFDEEVDLDNEIVHVDGE